MMRGTALVLALALPGVVSGQVKEWERFELYTECRPVLAVTLVSVSVDNWEAIEDSITAAGEAAVESRLRAAGLWWSSSETGSWEHAFLQATVFVDPLFPQSERKLYEYEVQLKLNKQLMDEFGNKPTNTQATWTRTVRPRGLSFPRSEQEVLDAVSSAFGRLLDQFLAAYLRVNGSAC